MAQRLEYSVVVKRRDRGVAMTAVPAIISVHDVMPQTMDNVETLLSRWLPAVAPDRVVLLVVPGLDWQPRELDRLRTWQRQGYELAGHGWRHSVQRVDTAYHRLHSALVSRNVAEHLPLSEHELDTLLRNNHQWFEHHDFTAPELYVPPAWALGKLSAETLQRLPFRYYESTTGLLDSQHNRFRRLPLAGFEADRYWRVPGLRTWNGINRLFASLQRPLRLSIHPFDHELCLARSLKRWVAQVQPVAYRSLFNGSFPESGRSDVAAM